MLRYYLQINNGPPVDITGLGVFTLGRNGYVKVMGEAVSRIHCMIDITTHPPLITDGDGTKASKNGTLVNGAILSAISLSETEKSAFLHHNDLIQIGTVSIRFLCFQNDEDSDINATK